ncbi:unnamed protein product [Dicrocoelium dendriticum]|nr:unnamed protein product [Dicrocoelium dendriticum]
MTAVAGRFPSEFRDPTQPVGTTNMLAETSSSKASSSYSLCFGCGAVIRDPFILHVQPDLEWHGRCLNCFKCSRPLGDDPTCFVRDGKAYCREDYFNTFHCRCAGCHQVVSRCDLVYRVRSTAFHMACLRCAVCERLLQPGEEITLQNDQISCATHTRLLGLDDYIMSVDGKNRLSPPVRTLPTATGAFAGAATPSGCRTMANECQTCTTPASTEMKKMKGGPHRLVALRCRTVVKSCNASKSENLQLVGALDTEKFERRTVEPVRLSLNPPIADSRTPQVVMISRQAKHCETEALDSFCLSPHCSANTPGSSTGELVRDTDTPLTACSELSHGDANSSILGLSNSVSGFTDPGPNSSDNDLGPLRLDPCLAHSLGTAHNCQIDGSHTGSNSSSSGTSMTGGGGDDPLHNTPASRSQNFRSNKFGSSKRSKDQKTTRIRTVLNEKQLHTLRTCYAANPRPDALMKEQLVEMTSLSPRVIRVWFQNKRCKDKKRQILLKQIEQHQQNGSRSTSLHGISMVAGSPVCNDSGLMSSTSGIDIHQLPGPFWMHPTVKGLSQRAVPPCPTMSSGNPCNPLLDCNLTENAAGDTCSLTGPTCDASTSYVIGMMSNLITPFTTPDGPTVHSGPLTMLPPGLASSSLDTERSLFGLVGKQSEMSLVSDSFTDDAPAFQRLVSCFDASEGVLTSIPDQSVAQAAKRLANRQLSNGFHGVLYAAGVSTQMPPNIFIPPRLEGDKVRLWTPSREPNMSAKLSPSPQNDLPAFSAANAHSQPKASMVSPSSSTTPANLLPSPSTPQTSNFSVGTYLHGQVPQLQLGPQSRTSLST